MNYYQSEKTRKVEEKINLKSICYEEKEIQDKLIEFYLNQNQLYVWISVVEYNLK